MLSLKISPNSPGFIFKYRPSRQQLLENCCYFRNCTGFCQVVLLTGVKEGGGDRRASAPPKIQVRKKEKETKEAIMTMITHRDQEVRTWRPATAERETRRNSVKLSVKRNRKELSKNQENKSSRHSGKKKLCKKIQLVIEFDETKMWPKPSNETRFRRGKREKGTATRNPIK